ncbi:MAG: hypothetical protein AB9900_02675 [Humidesulfovibrio sp.]
MVTKISNVFLFLRSHKGLIALLLVVAFIGRALYLAPKLREKDKDESTVNSMIEISVRLRGYDLFPNKELRGGYPFFRGYKNVDTSFLNTPLYTLAALLSGEKLLEGHAYEIHFLFPSCAKGLPEVEQILADIREPKLFLEYAFENKERLDEYAQEILIGLRKEYESTSGRTYVARIVFSDRCDEKYRQGKETERVSIPVLVPEYKK